MRYIKPTCLCILVLSLVFSAFPVPVLAAPEGGGRAAARHVTVVEGDGSCDEPVERAILAGYLFDPGAAMVADPCDEEDDDEQGDQLGSAPVAIDSDFAQRHDPPGCRGVMFFDVVVRGKKTLLAVFSRAGPAGYDAAAEEESRASLLVRGLRAAADAGFDPVSGRRRAGLNVPDAAGRPSPLPPVVAALSPARNRPSSRGPAGQAPGPASRRGQARTWMSSFPGAAEAARPGEPSTAEAPAHAPSAR